jgi:protein O-GlcNAc transferase
MVVVDLLHRAISLHRSGKIAEAEAVYRQILSQQPQQCEALLYLGMLRSQCGDTAEAERLIGTAARLYPQSADVQFQIANLHVQTGHIDEALTAYGNAISCRKDFAEAYNNRGGILQKLGRHEEALADFAQAVTIQPRYLLARYNHAKTLQQLGRYTDALLGFDRVATQAPNMAAVHNDRGYTLLRLGRLPEALDCFDRTLALDPRYILALINRIAANHQLGRNQEALADSEKALTLKPDNGPATSSRFFISAELCDWRMNGEKRHALAAAAAQGKDIDIFALLHAIDDPRLHLAAARKIAVPRRRKVAMPAANHPRLRIAYLSPDFRDHPVAYQMAELLERHDRDRFEIYGFCVHPSLSSSPIRQRLEKSFDRFIAVGDRSDDEIADMLAAEEINIAVDLGGYADMARPQILARGPAPITATYLGYPGTLGTDYIDYLIADAQVVPPQHDSYFAEKIVRLPTCFMPADTVNRPTQVASRREAGLPETGFVFCAFNRSCKILPELFDVWMRLLQACADSVLWLNIREPATIANLRAEAAARGVAPERLIFAPHTETREENFARLALADLYLDTFPYGAHATASDFLWAGVPIVTLQGQSFASRVAASMLTTAGMSELIADSLEAYQAIALDLAHHPSRLAETRKLAMRARHSGLFDMDRLRRGLEEAYRTMWQRHINGLPPESFSVGDAL